MLLRTTLIFVLFGCLAPLGAQTSNISGIINHYTAVSAIDTCTGRLSVSDTSGFREGSYVFIIQMQGASINSADNSSYGTITDMRSAGKYERGIIDSVAANAIYVRRKFSNQYDIAGKVQAVTVPVYSNATVTDTLRAKAWDGSTGGIIAFEVGGTLTLNAPISASGAGFRGGKSFVAPTNNCTFVIPENDYFYALGNWRGSYKGEGIALPISGKEFGRGAQSNGGGGGNDHNSGGGGGSNIAKGGNGGDNNEPSTFGCRGDFPGTGGINLSPYASLRLFMGGGGGAGHTNNGVLSDGGNGGGIVILRANTLLGTQPYIYADGQSAKTAIGDGAGGGGAGGTIWLDVQTYTSSLALSANGGKGGNSNNQNQNRCFGTGGGGSGGRLMSTVGGLPNPQGGAAGIVQASTDACNGTTNEAEAGQNGYVEYVPGLPEGGAIYQFPKIFTSPDDQLVCEGETAVFSCLASVPVGTYQWQVNTGSVWADLMPQAGITGINTAQLTITSAQLSQNGYQFRCVIRVAGCSDTPSDPALLNVSAIPNAAFSSSVNILNVNFNNQSGGATTYFWDFGDGQTSTLAFPQHNYAAEGDYPVTLYAISPCDTSIVSQTVSVINLPTAGFTLPGNVTDCFDAVISPANQSTGTAVSYNWQFPGGNPGSSSLANPTVTYLATGLYDVILIVQNAAGADTIQQSIQVALVGSPVPDFDVVFQGNTADFTNLSSNFSGQSWDFGDGNTSDQLSPEHVYDADGNYLVTLTVWNTCDTVSFQQNVSVTLPPTAFFAPPGVITGCGTADIAFVNQSTGSGITYQWSFPGGIPAGSNLPDPVVSYNTSGNYSATLIVSNGAGSDTLTRNFSVSIQPLPLVAFSTFVSLLSGTVEYYNNSLNTLGQSWDFGDGFISSAANPTHVYGSEGNYTVTLTVWNDCDTVSLQQNVAYFLLPTANFTAPDTAYGCGAAVVNFLNLSSANSDQFWWSFQGGDPPVSTDINPTVTYNNEGTYEINLLASNSVGGGSQISYIHVVLLDNPVASFDYSAATNGVVQFSNLSNFADTYTWYFGDDTAPVSTDNPVHTYTESGLYTVTLIASNPCGASIYELQLDLTVVDAPDLQSTENALRIYPNPTSSAVTVDCSALGETPRSIQVFDWSGRLLLETSGALSERETLPLETLPAGTYRISVQFSQGSVVRKLIKLQGN